MNENIFDKLDFGPFRALLDNDDITDISFDNNGQIWVRSLTQGSLRVEVNGATPEFVEKLAFQCSNVMGTTFNNAKPFLDAESAELRLNFVHPSIATNGIAMVIRKTPAKIRLEKEKLINEEYFTQDIHDILIKCVEGHCNIIVSGETGSGKTEFVKYLASHTKVNEKIITIEDTLELHLDKIFPQRDIVAMKTNNVASYTDVLVTCMRQNPKWILLSEVRSAEAVSAVRNSISSGHNILSTIHADKAAAIPYRLYSLMETDLDVNQFLSTIYRYIQLGVHIKAYYSKSRGKFHREVDEVVEFYVDEDNQPQSRIIYQKAFGKEPILRKPSKHLLEYLENQNIDITAVTSHMEDDESFAGNEIAKSTSAEYKMFPSPDQDATENNYEYVEGSNNESSAIELPVGNDEAYIPTTTIVAQPEDEQINNIPLSDVAVEVQNAMANETKLKTEFNGENITIPVVNQSTVEEVPQIGYQTIPQSVVMPQKQQVVQQLPVQQQYIQMPQGTNNQKVLSEQQAQLQVPQQMLQQQVIQQPQIAYQGNMQPVAQQTQQPAITQIPQQQSPQDGVLAYIPQDNNQPTGA